MKKIYYKFHTHDGSSKSVLTKIINDANFKMLLALKGFNIVKL